MNAFYKILLILLFCNNSFCNTSDTLNIKPGAFKVIAPFNIIENAQYDWHDAINQLKKKKNNVFSDPGRVLRSYKTYWTGGTLVNDSKKTIPLMAEGFFAELRLDGQLFKTCHYDLCADETNLIKQPKSHVAYFNLPPGQHLFIAKLADYHLKADMAPSFSDRSSYESKLYSQRGWHIFLVIFLTSIFFLLSILSLSIFIKIKDWVFLYYFLFALFISVHSLRTLGETYEVYNIIDRFLPWYYMKYFWFAGIYYSYFKFGEAYSNANLKYPKTAKLSQIAIKLLIIGCIPEVLLISLGLPMYSYSYYFVFRYIMALYGLYVLYSLWPHRKDVYAQFILIGGGLLLMAELITSTFYNDFSRALGGVALLAELIVFSFALSFKIYREFYQKLVLENENQAKILTIQALRDEKTKLNMSTIQAQLNPHFIFNALNAIREFLLTNNSTLANEYLTKFASLMRKVLAYSGKESILLDDELEITKQFVEFHQLLSDKHIELNVNIDEGIEGDLIKVPPVVMQPYIENIFVHAFDKNQTNCTITINIYDQNEHVVIDIIDNGMGRKASMNKPKVANHNSMGLTLNNDRVANWGNVYGKICKVEIFDLFESNKPKGTKVTIML